MMIDTPSRPTRARAPARRVNRTCRAALSLALLAALCATDLAAAELTLQPFIRAGARFDSNPRFNSSRTDFDSALGTIIDARLPLEYRSPQVSISLNPRLVYSFYADADESDLEDQDQYLTGTANRLTQRSNIGASYGYTDLALRTSELQSAGDSSPGGSGGTGIFAEDTQQRWYFQPYWQFQYSQRNSITLNGGYEQVRYNEEVVSRRFNYNYSTASASFNHAFNERHSASLRATFAKFDSENIEARVQNDSETNSLSLIYTYAWSETTQLTADLGWARTQNEVLRPNNIDPVTGLFCDPAFIIFFPCEIKSDSTNFVGNLSATKQSETIEYEITIGQSITPNSNGAEVLRFNIDAVVKKTFTRRLSGRLGVTAFTQDDVGDTDRTFERDYIRGDFRLNYRFARRWSIYGAYSYTFNDEQRALISDRTVRNHFASIGVTFEADGWRW